jgi:apolipoprotein N-acyltransferase
MMGVWDPGKEKAVLSQIKKAIAGLYWGLSRMTRVVAPGILIGFYFGLGYFALGIHWIYFSLHDFGHAAPIVAGLITVLLIMLQAMYIGLLGLAYRHIKIAFSCFNASI